MTIERNPTICFNVIFGRLEIRSPYLWKKGFSLKPLNDLGIHHHGRSEAVNRALSDFGIEDSFAQAAERFEEHYKYAVSPSTVSRETEHTADEAVGYVSRRLSKADELSEKIEGKGEAADLILIELDGCEIRTAISKPVGNSRETTEVYGNPKKEKIMNRRDVRIGFSRPMDSVSKIFVGKKDVYPEVVNDLVKAAKLSGMSSYTRIVGVSDGGIGLKEELENQFPNMQFILDKIHLKDHLFETAEDIGIGKKERPGWVNSRLKAISGGEVEEIIKELEREYELNSNHRLKRLIGCITRFKSALNYDDFKAKGYPVGSGEIESAHRYIPQKRLKLPGASWHPDSINPMLALRVLRANDWWEDFWTDRIEMRMAA
jgi:hypothetical protein